MSESGENNIGRTEEPVKSPAQQAAEDFEPESREYPGFTVAHSIALAIKYQESGADPKQLGDALLADADRVQGLVDAGNLAHQEAARAKNAEPLPPLTVQKMSVMIQKTFNLAETSMLRPKEVLVLALSAYRQS